MSVEAYMKGLQYGKQLRAERERKKATSQLASLLPPEWKSLTNVLAPEELVSFIMGRQKKTEEAEKEKQKAKEERERWEWEKEKWRYGIGEKYTQVSPTVLPEMGLEDLLKSLMPSAKITPEGVTVPLEMTPLQISQQKLAWKKEGKPEKAEKATETDKMIARYMREHPGVTYTQAYEWAAGKGKTEKIDTRKVKAAQSIIDILGKKDVDEWTPQDSVRYKSAQDYLMKTATTQFEETEESEQFYTEDELDSLIKKEEEELFKSLGK